MSEKECLKSRGMVTHLEDPEGAHESHTAPMESSWTGTRRRKSGTSPLTSC